MIRSLGLILGVVLVIVLITIRTQGQEIRVVDYSATLTEARRVAPFEVLAPEKLAVQWQATSGDYSPAQVTRKPGVVLWHVGYVTPLTQYVGLEQTNGLLADVLKDQLGAPVSAGTSTVNGVTWNRWSNDKGRHGLSLMQDKVVVLVHGSADWVELEQFAGSLRAG